MIEVKDLTKKYGETAVVDHIRGRGDFRLPGAQRRGEIHHDEHPHRLSLVHQRDGKNCGH